MSFRPSALCAVAPTGHTCSHRSEEHTSELQSLQHLVCRLLLEKQEKLKVRIPDDGNRPQDTTVGRVLFWELIPVRLAWKYVNRVFFKKKRAPPKAARFPVSALMQT